MEKDILVSFKVDCEGQRRSGLLDTCIFLSPLGVLVNMMILHLLKFKHSPVLYF